MEGLRIVDASIMPTLIGAATRRRHRSWSARSHTDPIKAEIRD
jgi:hypothetical protein